jgi:ubiquinol-cytochrome c reductase cytochrome b subunit
VSAATRKPTKNWTVGLRAKALATLPPETLLPDGQPTYMSSWIYVFGVLSIAALVTLILTGTILTLKGPAWWHDASVGHFINSMHLWAAELFFFFMVVHLWGKYWMAAWRGGRIRIWVTGAVTFLIAIPCALTGYVAQENLDAQWISTQAKDAMNATGIGSFFNLTNFGQVYSLHIWLMPLLVAGLVAVHILMVRRNGIVPPFQLDDERFRSDKSEAAKMNVKSDGANP